MATTVFSSSSSCLLPSSPFLHRNPKPSSLLTISISKPSTAFFSKRCILFTRASVQLAVPAKTKVPHVSIDGDLLDISKLGISEQIVSALSRRGITELFPIQRAVLEPAMEGRDMIGRAITGSGKTLAFGIPILDKIIRNQSQHRKNRVPSALVLAPTRELARQVQKEFKESAPSLSSTCLYGGIPITNQVRALGFGIDIAVGTPGRIIDLVERGSLDLSEVKFVVLDEADQMLAIGFQEAVECILSYLPAKKQCMLFSATMPSWVNELSRKYLRDPLVIDLVGDSDQKLADGISLYSVASSTPNKQNLLTTLISKYAQGGKSIIFTRTKKDAESLSRSMGRIIGSKALHGNMQQFQRDRTLAAFRDGRFNVLVATDVAARGLDIPNVDLVVHFEMPNTSEIFVHRSGRTGRAGNKGTAVLMFTESQRREVRSIERDLRCKFEELRGIVGVGNRNEAMHREGSFDEEYNDTVGRQLGGSDHFYDRRSANNGRFQGHNYGNNTKNKVPRSNASRYSEGRFGSYERPGKNQFSRNSAPREIHSAQTRRTQFSKHDDFENNYSSERDTGMNSMHWTPRRQIPKFNIETESDASDRDFGERTNRQKGKRSSSISASSHDDFDQILDMLKDQY